MENFKIQFFLNVNLTHRSSIAVISSLWNQDHIIAEIENILLAKPVSKYWAEIEKDVLFSLRKLELPTEIKINLENFIQPMGRQIHKWIKLTAKTFQAYPHSSKPIKFMWTENGILDYYNVTKSIIQDNSDKKLCFCLACIFCIEEIILKLWPEVRHSMTEMINKDPFSADCSVFVTYWKYYLNGEVNKLMALSKNFRPENADEFAFLLTLQKRCVPSVKYFLQRIQPPEKRIELVVQALRHLFHIVRNDPCDGYVILYLFSQLKEYNVNEIIRQNPLSVLASLLEWPCQEHFKRIATTSLQHMSNLEYLNLFQNIVEYVSKYYMGNLYENFFEQFWQMTPSSIKKHVISKRVSGAVLRSVLLHENTDRILQIILHDCNPHERQQMIFNFVGMNLCDLLVRIERWQQLRLFIKSCNNI